MLADVALVLDQFVAERLLHVGGARAKLRDPINHIHHQVRTALTPHTSPIRWERGAEIAPLIVAGPGPDADTGGAVFDGGIHIQPLWGGLLAADDQIDVVAAAQAMVGNGKEAVGVRW